MRDNNYMKDNNYMRDKSYMKDNNYIRDKNYRKDNNYRNSVLGIIGNALLSLAFAGVCLMFVLWIFGVEPKIVASGSMEPEIRVGSLCFVNTRADYDKLEVGDVIAYYALDGSQVTHRIVEITNAGIITKGDANTIPDGIPITRENYMGRTGISIPYLGYFFVFMQTTVGKMIIIGLVVVMLTIQVIQTRAEIMFRRRRAMARMLAMKENNYGK